MKQRLDGKKLLIISSDGNDKVLVQAGKELGLYTICCDRYTDYSLSPAKLMADEVWDIDYTHTEKVAEKCKNAGVDGVIAGYAENRVEAAAIISEAIGTPFYATKEQIDLTRNKVLFKQMCKECDIPTPFTYELSLPLVKEQVESVRFPVIVKPSDSGGRKGIAVCYDEKQLGVAVENALAESRYKKVVVEQFLEGTELSAVYTIANGKASLSCLNDKYISTDPDSKGFLCNLVVAPSNYLKLYCEKVDSKVKALLHTIGAKNGVATFQMIACNDEIYIFEMGYRINGNNDFTIIEKENGLNYCHMLINYSLTGSMGDCIDKDNPFFSKFHGTFIVLLHSGKIAELDYNNLKKEKRIEDIYFLKQEGDVIADNSTNVHKAGMIKFSADTLDEIKQLVHFIHSSLCIRDENGNSMLFEEFDTSRMDY